MRQISLRNTPHLEFVDDKQFKKAMETYTIIQKAMDEIRQKEERAKAQAEGAPDENAPGEESGQDAQEEK